METLIIIESEADRKRAVKLIGNIPAEPLHEVIIQEHKEKRTISQNALHWKRLGIFANELGMTDKDLSTEMKKRHLMKIFERDDEGYAEMMETVRDIWRTGDKEKANRLFEVILERTSSRQANKKQMSEYMDLIEQDAIEMNIKLPHPEDLR